jgi:4-hydroxybenzoate polyprenyltransferase
MRLISTTTISLPLSTPSTSRKRMQAYRAVAAPPALNLIPAAGIAAFGWAFWHLQGIRLEPVLLVMWFAGGLLIYNADRIGTDAADEINVSDRVRRDAKFANLRGLLIVSAGLTLTAVPLLIGSLRLTTLVLVGTVTAIGYSVRLPLLSCRIKDVPIVKTLFPPLAITVAIAGMPLLCSEVVLPEKFAPAIGWAAAVLLFNVILCDMRDITGDRITNVRSWPAICGVRNSALTLLGLIGVMLLSCPLPILFNTAVVGYLGITALAFPAASRRQWYYDWLVDGVLFVPVIVVLSS